MVRLLQQSATRRSNLSQGLTVLGLHWRGAALARASERLAHLRLQMRQACRLIKEAESQRSVCQFQYYRYIYGQNAPLDSLKLCSSLEEYIWVNSLVRSRSFGTEIEGEGVTIMAPFLDLANHARSYVGSFRVASDGCESGLC